VPYEVKLYDVPSLFAGKIHAVICRAWQNRVKGRDLYDYVFYLARGSEANQKHLRERLLQTGHITEDTACSLDEIKQALHNRFNSIDFEQAKSDVEPFIRDTSVMDLWSTDFFKQITDSLKFN
jgi:predicted nucleotidyltransferase component of viral defense system